MKAKNKIIPVLITLMPLIPGTANADIGGETQSAILSQIEQESVVGFVNSARVSVAEAMVSRDKQASRQGVQDGDISNCFSSLSDDIACQRVFEQMMENLQRMMSKNYSFYQKLNVFDPSKVEYTQATTKSLISALLEE